MLRLGNREFAADEPVIMAIVNRTPDSFYDRGATFDDGPALERVGRAVAEGLMAGGVLPVMKHMPGHGRAACDSHHGLPVVEASLESLAAQDFRPFRALADLPMAMSAHVVYAALDPHHPATQSSVVIEQVIRGLIGFDGLLMTDDLSMKALDGTFRQKAEKAFAAGIDVALHCNGDRQEMQAVLEGTPILSGEALRRAEAALARLAPQEKFDVAEARSRFEAGLSAQA